MKTTEIEKQINRIIGYKLIAIIAIFATALVVSWVNGCDGV